MNLEIIFPWIEFFFLSYFSAVNAYYTFFLLIGTYKIYRRYRETLEESSEILLKSDSLPEVMFIVPMHNESKNILANLHNILNLSYRYKKVIAVNDGSTDDTLEIVKKEFDLVPIPKNYEDTLPTAEIKGVYQSRKYPDVIVIDKEGRGKYDAVNAAVNVVSTPFFVILDADTLLDNTGFEKLVRPMLTSPGTIAVGATIRIVNGCEVEFNRIVTTSFPKEYLPAMQAIEYLRSFLLREGLDIVNSNYIVSGAFGIFPRELVLRAGGLSPSCGEDAEIIVRLHRIMKELKIPYRIKYLPDPIAWTVAPSTFKTLAKQRKRWHQGILETIWFHKKMVLNPRYGYFGVVGFSWWILGEVLEPVIELLAWSYVIVSWSVGLLNIPFFILILALSFGFTSLYSVLCLLIEEMTFRKYPSLKSLTILFICNFVENIGYRQCSVYWRLSGFVSFFKNLKQIRKNSLFVKELIAKCVNQWPKKAQKSAEDVSQDLKV